MMDEFDFIKSIQQKRYLQDSLIRGVGDDAAVFRQSYRDIVTSVDTFVENIHFSRRTMLPYHIGYRVLAANISDMAAMGSEPAYYLISIVIPKTWSEQDLTEIYRGMKDLAGQYKIDLIGGDTVSGNELVISVTIIGFVEKDKARYRSNALDKDIVFVTGTLGDAAAGFHLLSNYDEKTQREYQYLIDRHRMPSPRVTFANGLQKLSRVTLNDISDGIANEAAEIAEASEKTLQLDYNRIPSSSIMLDFKKDLQRKWKLFGGEDFELIGTASEQDWSRVKQIAAETNTRVTKVGFVIDHLKTNGSVFLQDGNNVSKLTKSGYTHLK